MFDLNKIFNFYYGWWKNIDKFILFLILLLFSLGLFFSLVSTSIIASDKLNTNTYYFFIKHFLFIILGIFILITFSAVNQKKLFQISKYFKNIKGYIFGKDVKFFKKKLNKKIVSISTNNLENILKKIAEEIKLKKHEHSHILFSPSAASFDKFKNFEERGRYFNFLIKKTKFIKKINARFE